MSVLTISLLLAWAACFITAQLSLHAQRKALEGKRRLVGSLNDLVEQYESWHKVSQDLITAQRVVIAELKAKLDR